MVENLAVDLLSGWPRGKAKIQVALELRGKMIIKLTQRAEIVLVGLFDNMLEIGIG